MTTDMRQRVEEQVNKGLLGQWYVIAKSVQLRAGKPLGIAALGRNLVLWRDEKGEAHCLEDYCPHRGARLSRGEVHEGNIACRYHGIVLDGSGTILKVPAMPDCVLEGRKAAESFTVMERHDAVFVYFPSIDQPEPVRFKLPYELEDEAWAGFLCSSLWNCNYRYAIENTADPMHGCYLHANSFTLAYGIKQDLVKIEPADEGFIVTRVSQVGDNFDWSHVVTETSAPYFRVDIPYPKSAGPGGHMRVVGFVTPVDEQSCRIFFWRMRKVSGLEREAWRFLFRASFEEKHWHVLEQDREMLESMPGDARHREMLYQHDLGVGRIRQILKRRAEKQINFADQQSLQRAN